LITDLFFLLSYTYPFWLVVWLLESEIIMASKPVIYPAGFAPGEATAFADSLGNAVTVSNARPLPVQASQGVAAVDLSLIMPVGQRKIAPVDPDREALIVHNPGGSTIQIGTMPVLDGTARAGAITVAAGATVRLDPGATSDVFAWSGTASAPLTVTAMRRQRASRRSLAATANRSMASVDTVPAGDASRTYHVWQQVRGDSAVADLELVFAAWYYAPLVEADPANLPTITCDIEYPIGFKTRVTFAGALVRPWAAGETLISDMVPIRLPAGAWFRVNTCVTYATGATLGLFTNSVTVPFAPGAAFPSGRIDQWSTGDLTMRSNVNNNSASYPFAPFAVLGTCEIDAPKSVALFVDSIGLGVGAFDAPDAGGNTGWSARLLYQLGGIPYVRIGRGGATIAGLVGSEGTEAAASTSRLRPLLRALRCSHALVQAGTNDLSAATVAQTRIALGKVQSLVGGVPLAVGTVLPRATGSTDAYTSTAGQTRVPYYATIEGYNSTAATWTDGAGGISVIDAYAAVAAPGTGAAAGYWATDAGALVSDGVHPNGAGETRVATNAVCQSQARAWLAR
jgi:lysophospholipase L1-like esterase